MAKPLCSLDRARLAPGGFGPRQGGGRNNSSTRPAFDAWLEGTREEREARAAYDERARRLQLNPHNVDGFNGQARMANFEFWAAVFEREGRDAPRGLPNPYAKGTMAANRWEAGHFDRPPAA